MATPIAPDAFRAAMAAFPSGVTVVTTVAPGGTTAGLTVSSFASLSLIPPLCVVCVDQGASSLPVFKAASQYVVNVLAEDQDDLSQRFAFGPGDRFDGIEWQPGPHTGSPVLPGVAASIECKLHAALPGGDHDILVGMVVGACVDAVRRPLLYWQGSYGDVVSR